MKNKIIIVFIVLLGLSWFASLSSMFNNPKDYQMHIAKAEDLENRGIYVDAISEYETALQYDTQNVELIVKIANDYLKIDEKKKYVSTLQKAVEAEAEGSEDALNLLMNYYIDEDNEYKAAQYIRDYTNKSPNIDYANKWLIKLKGSYQELYCRYDEMLGMYNDCMIVKTGDVYSAVDSSGNRLLEKSFSELDAYSSDGYARTKNEKGETIFIDKEGLTRVVPNEGYDNIGILNNERIVASTGNKYGYLDETGAEITEFQWENVTAYNKSAMAKKNGKWAIIGSKGKEKTEYIFDDVLMDQYGVACNQERFFVKDGAKYIMIDTKGKTVSDETYDNAKIFNSDGYAAICQNGKWGYVDPNGEIKIKCQYDDAKSFSNGYAAVCIDNMWGYIDMDNNMIIAANLVDATDFSSEGTAAIKIKGENDDPDEWRLIKLNMKQ